MQIQHIFMPTNYQLPNKLVTLNSFMTFDNDMSVVTVVCMYCRVTTKVIYMDMYE
jgi:hypothetical protein